jgi:hypothetical protein
VNRRDAKKIAETITRDQLGAMMMCAMNGVKDWSEVSSVNPYFTKGRSWNIFYPVFMSGRHLVKPSITNMVHEFGDFLPEDLKPKKPVKNLLNIEPLHEEPNFGAR